ncbi:MAG: NADH-quinone oxidoreductase subunit NuoH [Flavobacteriia bacterium]|jgi:NADH-quinone oxidoreductase subunit H|nr:NADH-quinone oxidoreductase subunit NuoH [Flavobacteriia bacterium]NBV68246.1 NADH-quinone oxidoreductase subunit NuoH [Flavobacteriia bacterium]NBV90788.1 NADH-quinone oxidoreductase subunit NuoH [Flavobacteriia bacterium]NBY40053.1 NADH-quinone oxidoreductase subunit NuoH [Flavobacteriia bacterium]
METFYWIDKLVIVLILFLLSLGIAAYQTYFERKLAAWIQDRVGPDRAGPFGILQPIADGVKMFMKEDFTPVNADKWLFILGPGIAMFTSLITSAIVPWGTDLHLFGRTIVLQVAEINIGILFAFGIISIGVYGIMIGGWASNNKYSLFGAIRASSQMISYELAMGISAITIVMISGSLNLKEIVESQHGMNWNIFYQPVAFIVFFICALAETNRAPFDLPECENELIGGYHTEYSSMKLGLFLFSEYVAMFVSSAIMAILFFGGYNFPGMDYFEGNTLSILSILAFFTKIFIFIFVFMWIRWTIPRFRFDQLMHLGWKVLIPIALVNMLITGFVVAFYEHWF